MVGLRIKHAIAGAEVVIVRYAEVGGEKKLEKDGMTLSMITTD